MWMGFIVIHRANLQVLISAKDREVDRRGRDLHRSSWLIPESSPTAFSFPLAVPC